MRAVLPVFVLMLAIVGSSAAAQPRTAGGVRERPGTGVTGANGAAGAGSLSGGGSSTSPDVGGGGSSRSLDVRGTIRVTPTPGIDPNGCCAGQGSSENAPAAADNSAADR